LGDFISTITIHLAGSKKQVEMCKTWVKKGELHYKYLCQFYQHIKVTH